MHLAFEYLFPLWCITRTTTSCIKWTKFRKSLVLINPITKQHLHYKTDLPATNVSSPAYMITLALQNWRKLYKSETAITELTYCLTNKVRHYRDFTMRLSDKRQGLGPVFCFVLWWRLIIWTMIVECYSLYLNFKSLIQRGSWKIPKTASKRFLKHNHTEKKKLKHCKHTSDNTCVTTLWGMSLNYNSSWLKIS